MRASSVLFLLRSNANVHLPIILMIQSMNPSLY